MLRTVAYLLASGYIACYFSEWMFWSGRPTWEIVLSAPYTWMLYSFVSWLMLGVVRYFRVRSVWAWLLVGALYGWLIEGVIVQTTYDDFPLNLSFTALAWHAPLSIVFGLYALPQWLGLAPRLAWRAAAGFGVFLGLWSIGWWAEVPVAPAWIVFVYNAIFTLLLAGAYIVRNKLDEGAWYSKPALVAGGALLFVYYLFVTIPAQPMAIYVLPPLLILTFVALRRNRQVETATQENFAAGPHLPITIVQTLPLLLIPLLATAIYAVGAALGLVLPTLIIVFAISMPLGFILFGVSLYRVWRQAI